MSKIGLDKLTEILKIFQSMTCEEYDVLFKMLDEKKPFATCIDPAGIQKWEFVVDCVNILEQMIVLYLTLIRGINGKVIVMNLNQLKNKMSDKNDKIDYKNKNLEIYDGYRE